MLDHTALDGRHVGDRQLVKARGQCPALVRPADAPLRAYVNMGNHCSIYVDDRVATRAGPYQAPGPAPSPIDLSIGELSEGIDNGTFEGEVRAFRATVMARYKQTFVPPRRLQKDAGTVILLDFAGAGPHVKDLAGNHDGKIITAD